MGAYVIAEAGVNHNGSLDLAFKLVDGAVEAGADAIKFQTFKADKLVQKTARMARYQIENMGRNESQYDMLKRLELSIEDHFKLKDYCQECEIDFLSTPFDLESIDFLCGDLGLGLMKVPSGEITNGLYLYKIARYGVDMIVSTGMANMTEIAQCLDIIAFGYLSPTEPTCFDDFQGYASRDEAKEILQQKLTLLHCTTEYPAPFETINLRAMDTLRDTFELKAGFSDHSQGSAVPLAAIARGACVLEKHITLDNKMEGPDHSASMEIAPFKDMIVDIRRIECALGDGHKKPFERELDNKKVVRKGLYAACNIDEGATISPEDLIARRPETSVSPMMYWDIVNRKSKKAYDKDDAVLEI